ncbi:MAG TPA: hypothetical protein VIY68_09650 [Steroidobacteraceae bacterium]
MNHPSHANFELSIVLPLGVVANQLMKVEADLRFLNAKTTAYAGERTGADMAGQVAARLEKINEALEVIRALVLDIELEFQPRSMNSRALKARTERDD